jgi:hypothetical protein
VFAAPQTIAGSIWVYNFGTASFAADVVLAGGLTLNTNLNGSGNVTITGPFLWNSTATSKMSGAGKTTLSGTSQIIPASNSLVLSRTLENTGTLTLSPTSTTLNVITLANGIVNNLANGTINLVMFPGGSNCRIGATNGTTNAFNNAGVINIKPISSAIAPAEIASGVSFSPGPIGQI